MASNRKVKEINASSMADISFLLLIFFLVTTSMDVSTGLSRRLPPPVLDKTQKPVDINKRNIFVVKINSMNQLLVQGQELSLKELRAKTKEFIKNENNDPSMPVKTTEYVEFFGDYEITKEHVVSLQNDVDTQYQAYIDVQNELVAAYNELRNELAQQKFGKIFDELNEAQQKAIQTIYPQKISEAEPKNYGGTK